MSIDDITIIGDRQEDGLHYALPGKNMAKIAVSRKKHQFFLVSSPHMQGQFATLRLSELLK